MTRIGRFVIWICSKFCRLEIEQIINELLEVLNNRIPEVKPKDDFKEKHPNYRKFYVDPLPPLTEQPTPIPEPVLPSKNYKLLMEEYRVAHGKPITPVKHHSYALRVPEHAICPLCGAPSEYIYYNDGQKKTQLKCKICTHLFQLERRLRKASRSKYFCPYCNCALFVWKQRREVTIHKCCNNNCLHRTKALSKLNSLEHTIRHKLNSQFKLNYQYREYHFKPDELIHSQPEKPAIDLTKIHNGINVLGLVLTFYVSFAISARKTALIMRSVFGVNISYQTVLNYSAAAAYYCHTFNLQHKGDIDDISAGDETYIKIAGKHHYVFFFISSKNHKITAYHVADNRGEQPSISAMSEAIRTAKPDQEITLITDGNPSYPAGIHFINSLQNDNPDVQHHKVIGLQNLDNESAQYRSFKQLIERLNRTFKHHIKPSHGFNVFNGAVTLTTLFVTHYNFLRPHMSLFYKTPVQLTELKNITTIQGKWAKILSLTA